MIELAKPAIDVGLFTNTLEPLLSFWQQRAGVPFAELLPLGGGLQQHRHAIGASVLKINHSRTPLPAAPASGIRSLSMASAVTTQTVLGDPDGNRVVLVPPGDPDCPQLLVDLTVSDLDAHRRFYAEALGFPEQAPGLFACGDSRLRLTQGDANRNPEQRAPGYRYLTIQVFDVRGCHAAILANGGREGRAPLRVGDVAHISFVLDPDGNWIEVSQRKSITGTLD